MTERVSTEQHVVSGAASSVPGASVAGASAVASTAHVGLLFDSISKNTGDIAIGLALHQLLGVADDVTTVTAPLFRPEAWTQDVLVVGGGELIRPKGDPFYDTFRAPGPHILNGVGVWQDADDLDYLRQYAFVSARSSVEAQVLRRAVDDVEVVPDLTTCLRSEPYAIDGAEPGERLVGVHVVPHTFTLCPDIVDIVDALPGRKVFLPFTHYNFDRSFMRGLQFDLRDAIFLDELEPLQLHSVIGQLDLLVASSLHASIFAYSQNVPFVSVRQRKVVDYFSDRELQHLVFGDGAQLRSALESIQRERPDFTDRVSRDRRAIDGLLATYRDIITASRGRAAPVPPDERAVAREQIRVATLLGHQTGQVVQARDVLIGGLLQRLREQEVELRSTEHQQRRYELSQLRSELEAVRFHRARDAEEAARTLAATEHRLRVVAEQYEALMNTRTMRALRVPRAGYGLVRRVVSRLRRWRRDG